MAASRFRAADLDFWDSLSTSLTGSRLRADRLDLAEQVRDPAFEGIDLRGWHMVHVGAEPAAIRLGMDRDLIRPQIEDPNHTAGEPHPDLMAEVFGGHRVKRPVDLGMPGAP